MTSIATQIRSRLDAIAEAESPFLQEVRRIAKDPPPWWRDVYRDLSGRRFPLSADDA